MPKAVPVILGDEYFAKKGDLQKRIQGMIDSYPVMNFLEGADITLCLSLFAYHPNYIYKVGAGIQAIQVRLDNYGNRYLHLHRVDGSDEDISWTKCLRSIR